MPCVPYSQFQCDRHLSPGVCRGEDAAAYEAASSRKGFAEGFLGEDPSAWASADARTVGSSVDPQRHLATSSRTAGVFRDGSNPMGSVTLQIRAPKSRQCSLALKKNKREIRHLL